MYIVIRAGGVGTRLWPVSRVSKPKQLHALVSQHTLLQESVNRVKDITDDSHVYVSCNADAKESILENVPDIPKENLIIEPSLRDTAAAVGLETITIARENPQAIIASLGSDHVINDSKEFQRVLKLAEEAIKKNPDHILCIGINPTTPDTGYGYIELDEEMQAEVFKVKSFKEKPNADLAEQFIQAGNYLWNANMFVWRADTVLKLFEKHQPEMYKKLIEIQEHPERLNEIYSSIEKVAVDYAIIEKTDKILAISGSFGWNDIGDWSRLKTELANAEHENYSKADHIDINSSDTLVFSDTEKFIATIGLHNIVIVDTGDALLVCDKSRSQDVKKLVSELKKQGRSELL